MTSEAAETHWTFVGAGNMAASLVGGLLGAGARAEDVALVDPDEATRRRVAARFGVRAVERVDAVPAPGDGVARGFVLAVKPDVVERACRAIAAANGGRSARRGSTPSAVNGPDEAAPEGGPDDAPLVVSVAAGVRLDALGHWLAPRTPIVRCMPNTPALLGLGATGLYPNAHCSERQVARAEALLGTCGATVRVDEEGLLDAVTALSGSGPAYLFYLVEQMAAAGERLGLDAETARELAIETAFGAASMARAREAEPAELRRRVTSKGGTTAAALAVFDAAGLPDIVLRAMRAAQARAVELGDEHAPGGAGGDGADPNGASGEPR